jgi:nucleotide-binding universal stress UspA family protein
MKHFKKILATTDLSSESLSTVRYAIHLAKAQRASVTIVHVPVTPAMLYPVFSVPVDLTSLFREIETSARKRLEHWIKRNARDVKVDMIVRHGITHDTICKTAEDLGASVIVMSTHGRKGIGHTILGSITERVLRDAPCPVLVVRPTHEAGARKNSDGGGKQKKAA